MSSSYKAAKTATKIARPLMSIDCKEAHTRVLSLYRHFYRYIPYIVKYHDIPKSNEQVHQMLRQLFYKHSDVTDLRIIDMLVIKGFIELKEIRNQWQQKHHVMRHWNPSIEPKPTDFFGKFIANME